MSTARPGASAEAASAARGGLSLLATQLVARFAALAFLVVVTGSFSPDAFGRYSIATAVVAFGGIFADLGITTAITRAVAADRTQSDRLLAGTILPSALLGLIGWAVCIGFAIVAGYPHAVRVDIAVAGAALPFSSMLTSMLGALDGIGEIAKRSVLSLGQALINVVVGGALVISHAGPRLLIASTLSGPIIVTVAAWAAVHRMGVWLSRPRFDISKLMNLFLLAAPFAALAGLAMLYRRFDLIVLSLFHSRTQVANYDVVLRLIDGLGFLGSAISAPSLFLMSRRLEAGDSEGTERALRLAARAVYLVGFASAAVLLALSQDFVHVIFGPSYRGATTPLAILGAAIWLDFVGVVQGAALAAGRRLRQAIMLSVILALGLMAFDITLIYQYAATGAAIAMAAFEAISVLAVAIFNRRVNGVALPRPELRVVAAAGVACGAMKLAESHLHIYATFVGLIVYVLVVITTGAVGRDDVAVLKRVTRSAPSGGA